MRICMPLSRVRHVACLATSAALLSGGVALAQPLGGDPGPQVMGWVPAYGIDAATKALASTPAIGQSLTRVGLQFWNPSVDGKGIVLAPQDATGKPVTVAQVKQLQHWARAHGVQ